MAHSLEVRTPFLDHRLAEYMNRVSFSSKMTGGRQKYILRKALERYLPPEFLWRKKQGFVVPLAHWFKGDLEGLIRDRLLAPNASVHRVIPRSAIEHLLASHSRGHRDWSSALWALLMFELWCRAYGIEEEDLAVAC